MLQVFLAYFGIQLSVWDLLSLFHTKKTSFLQGYYSALLVFVTDYILTSYVINISDDSLSLNNMFNSVNHHICALPALICQTPHQFRSTAGVHVFHIAAERTL